ncbi:MAG: hypothetical protein DRP52_06725 [Planctomycetota bacterium]|nr:MAG: hypothetical protein DRP52_06725 [Planctomycetota bacterium]
MKAKCLITILVLGSVSFSSMAGNITWGSRDLTAFGMENGWVVALYKDTNQDGWGATAINFADGSTDSDDVFLEKTTTLQSGKTGISWGDNFSFPGVGISTNDYLISVIFNNSIMNDATAYWFTDTAEASGTGDQEIITIGGIDLFKLPSNTLADATYFTTTIVPEPATALLFSIGGMGAWMLRRKNQRARMEAELEE